MRPVDLIGRKRDGGELSREEYAAFVGGYLDGSVMEGQMAALLMAGVLRGFTDAEARALTAVLVGSGSTLDLSGIDGPTIDKHSTGGVGDGTSLLVAPLLAAAGCTLVKLSGRGLGHSGGTLDKLESIPGMRVALPDDEILRIAREIGCVVAAQTDALVPADKALYALRDVTGTVASMALIASSVMSKKLAAGAGTIVLDVKTGDGAFMATREDAVALARLCVGIGVDGGRRCSALVTDMDTPLGGGIGNALEVRESVLLLQKAPDPGASRLTEVALALATEAFSLATGSDAESARRDLELLWAGAEPLERLRRMIAAQGGDPRVVDAPDEVLPSAPVRREVPAARDGVVARIPARAVGELSVTLGAGRRVKSDAVDPSVGIDLHVAEGDRVALGQPLATIHARNDDEAAQAAAELAGLITLGDEGRRAPTVLEAIRA